MIARRRLLGLFVHVRDSQTVGATDTERVADLPAGASRLVKHALGVTGTWVNGTRVVKDGKLVVGEARPGMLMREFDPPAR